MLGVTRDGVLAALSRIGLPAWFVAIDVVWRIPQPLTLGVDARHYQRAANAWLSGGDPYAVTELGVPYASGPHTLLFYAPTSLLPDWLATWVWILIGLGAAVWVVHRLALPWYWLLFPPLLHAIWNGNPQTLVVALLVAGGPVASTAAVAFKLYAAVPLLWRSRDLLVAGVALTVALPFVATGQYVASGGNANALLFSGWSSGAWGFPPLILPTVLALWVLRGARSEWLTIPTLWPGMQFYYVSTAMPALVGRPLLAAAIALPAPLAATLATIALAAITLVRESERPIALAIRARAPGLFPAPERASESA